MTILILEQNSSVRKRYAAHLSAAQVRESANPAEALALVKSGDVPLVVMGDAGGGPWQSLEVLTTLRNSGASPDVIFVAQQSSEDLVIAALRAGAWDYLKAPVYSENVRDSVNRWSAVHVDRSVISGPLLDRLVGQSPAILLLRDYINKVALSECNVLITGETGTGKEIVAELIHSQGPRAKKPFICINCAAVPDLLLESELFGYERGAFTGATTSKDGKMRQAEGGTLFLDEIGEMSVQSQAKILRALESREIQRLGGRCNIPIDVRVVAATNQALDAPGEKSVFRRDLFYRLSVARIELTPLCERREDIPLLIDHFVQKFSRSCLHHIKGFTKEAMRVLQDYPWPGNIRELRNVVEALFVNRPTCIIDIRDLPHGLSSKALNALAGTDHERDNLMAALKMAGWNKSKAAQQLNWSRMTIYRKMCQYGINEGPRVATPRPQPHRQTRPLSCPTT